jgi:hypothetical protein
MAVTVSIKAYRDRIDRKGDGAFEPADRLCHRPVADYARRQPGLLSAADSKYVQPNETIPLGSTHSDSTLAVGPSGARGVVGPIA